MFGKNNDERVFLPLGDLKEKLKNGTGDNIIAVINIRDFHEKRIVLNDADLNGYLHQFSSMLNDQICNKGVFSKNSDASFIIMLDSFNEVDDVNIYFQKIIDNIKMTGFINSDGELCSYNLALCFTRESTTYETLNRNISICSIGLEKSVKENMPTVIEMTPDSIYKTLSKNRIKKSLFKSIERDELFLVYQPIVEVKGRTRVGAECLIRWNNKELGMIPPDLFIAEAEKTDFIHKLGHWIISHALADAKYQFENKLWPADFILHINISPKQLEVVDFSKMLLSICKENNIPCANISLELTEQLEIKDNPEVINNINLATRHGLTFSIDDFGTGYSTFSIFSKLDFNRIKIDRSLIKDVDTKKDSNIIVSSIISMGGLLNKYIIAEGIETENMANALCEIDCPFAQGYLYGKPMILSDWTPVGEQSPERI